MKRTRPVFLTAISTVAASPPLGDVNLPGRSRAVANFVFFLECAEPGRMQSSAACIYINRK